MNKTFLLVFIIASLVASCSNPQNSGMVQAATPLADTSQQTTASPTAAPSPSQAPPTATQPEPTPQDTPSSDDGDQAAGMPVNVDSLRLELVTSELQSTTGLENAGDGSGRLFALQQEGAIWIIEGGAVQQAPFLDLRDQVGSQSSEQGLLGLAFHPRYAENGYFYVNYTDLNGDTVIARYQVSSDPSQADPGSELVLMHIDQPFANHNGGGMVFGPDGYLYISLGDGGSAGDPQGNAQSLNTPLGKILRIDVDGGEPYAIPPDNPFVNGEGLSEIWVYGLRNPWRFSFDRQTGDLYIADVGQNAWEEIDFLPAGTPGSANFGWDYFEGSQPYEGTPPSGLETVAPVYEYDHSLGCSVTGGYVYRGTAIPALQGTYVYADYCSGLIWGLKMSPQGAWENITLFDLDGTISSFGEDESGEIYVVAHQGAIYRISQASIQYLPVVRKVVS